MNCIDNGKVFISGEPAEAFCRALLGANGAGLLTWTRVGATMDAVFYNTAFRRAGITVRVSMSNGIPIADRIDVRIAGTVFDDTGASGEAPGYIVAVGSPVLGSKLSHAALQGTRRSDKNAGRNPVAPFSLMTCRMAKEAGQLKAANAQEAAPLADIPDEPGEPDDEGAPGGGLFSGLLPVKHPNRP